MELESICLAFVLVGSAFMVALWLLKNANWYFYETKLGEKQYDLPPGDLGWPFVGNMWSFLWAFKFGDPDSFMASFVSRLLIFPISDIKADGSAWEWF